MGMFEEYIELSRELSGNKLKNVECVQAQAMGYVWGWKDNSMIKDERVSEDFAYAYGVHAAQFELGKINYRNSIQDAFQSYIKTGEIRRYGEY